jgi:hypothetical protein
MKFLYKPFGLVLGIIAGLLSRRVFMAVWSKIDDAQPPEAKTKHASVPKVVSAAALEAAVFAGVRAAVDRAGAHGFHHVTGVWPGETEPDPAD